MAEVARRHSRTPQRSRFDIWLRVIEIIVWIGLFLDYVLRPGEVYTMALIASTGGLTAIHIVTGKWRRQDRQPLLDWPPNESGIQHWRKKREERLQATDGPV